MIRLHLGVHKTATTYLQDLFELNRGRIALAGRAYWPLADVRPAMAFTIWADQAGRGLLGPLRRRALRRAPFNPLGPYLDAADSHVVSDENILGHASDALTGSFYPHAGGRLERLAAIVGKRPVEVWLCLRSYPGFLASLYAESLRHGALMPVSGLVAANREPGGQWPALIDAVHRAFPEARIAVWRYEDFAALEPVIVERLAGLPLAHMQRLSITQVRPSPSPQAIAAHLERAGAMSRLQRVVSMVMAEAEFPPTLGAGSFVPWPQDQAARMVEAHERDMAEVAALPFVEMLAG